MSVTACNAEFFNYELNNFDEKEKKENYQSK